MSAVNVVEVDGAALDREADTVLREAPSAESSEPHVQPDPKAEAGKQASGGEWGDITPGLVTLLTFVVFPQWGITTEEQGHVSKAAADVLEQVFPGGLHDARWAPWLRLVMVTGGVALARFDADSGFPPIGPRREKPVGPEQPTSQPSDAQQTA